MPLSWRYARIDCSAVWPIRMRTTGLAHVFPGAIQVSNSCTMQNERSEQDAGEPLGKADPRPDRVSIRYGHAQVEERSVGAERQDDRADGAGAIVERERRRGRIPPVREESCTSGRERAAAEVRDVAVRD